MQYLGSVAITSVVVAIWLYFWFDLQKRSAAERAAVQKREEDRLRREQEWRRINTRVRSFPSKRTAIVATPRTPFKANTPERTGVIPATNPKQSVIDLPATIT